MENEKKEVDASASDLSEAGKGLKKMDALDKLEDNLGKMESQSDEGMSKADQPDEEKAIKGEPEKEPEVTDREGNLEKANAAIDNLEAESGEKFGEKKPGFLGKIAGWFKKGTKAIARWFVSALGSIKKRIQAIFGKIKAKVADLLLNVTGTKDPMESLEQDVSAAKSAVPEARGGVDDTLKGIENNEQQAKELGEIAKEMKAALKD